MSRMNRFQWLQRQPRSPHVTRFDRRLRVELLEDRRLLAVFTVTSLSDAGAGSLREAIAMANENGEADTINFSVAGTIQLTSQLPTITQELTINGPGADLLTIRGGVGVSAPAFFFRIFNIDDGDDENQISVEISGLTLARAQLSVVGDHQVGGAIRNLENLVLANCILTGNRAQEGGALANFGTAAVIESTFTGNFAQRSGGAIYNRVADNGIGSLTVTRSIISGNSATTGGGIYNRLFSIANIRDSTLSGNSTTGVGNGGGIASYGLTNIVNSTLSGNTTTGKGGGILVGGGGFFLGTVNLFSSTLFENSASNGGGIANDGNAHVTSTIVAGNMAATNANVAGTLNTNVANLLSGDPLLSALLDYGGPTPTHRPLPGSPAINAGMSSEPFDQRGAPFLRNDGHGVDVGAFESQTFDSMPLIVTTTADELDFTNSDVSLREAIFMANQSDGHDTITFHPSLHGQTLYLSGGEFPIFKSLTLAGPGKDLLAIDAQQQSRLFNFVTPAGDLTISGLTLQNGRTTANNLVVQIPTGGSFLETTHSGGAIRFLSAGALTLSESTLRENSTLGDRALGGAIFAPVAAIAINQSTVSGNSTAGQVARGGAIYSQNGFVNVTQSVVSGNRTTGEGAFGGAIYGTEITLTESTLSDNRTTGPSSAGGGISASLSVILNRSTMSGNSTAGNESRGGGIFSRDRVELHHSTVSGNSTSGSASPGGGIASNSRLVMVNSTVTANRTTGLNSTGGGISLDAGIPFGQLSILSSIIAGNEVEIGFPGPGIKGPDIRSNAPPSSTYFNFSLIGDNSDSGGALTAGSGIFNVINVDPLLGPLANNGGPTQTHALLPGSPALDGGFSNEMFDQRGAPFLRRVGVGVDKGAVEVQPGPVSADFDDDGIVDGSDFLAWQRGVGSTNAVKADGDANNDMIVDGADLALWQDQYGTAPGSAAAALFGGETSESTSLLMSDGEDSLTIRLAALDAAMAFGNMAGDASKFETALRLEAGFAEQPATATNDGRQPMAMVRKSADAFQSKNSSEDWDPDATWLSEELLESVFG